jgi:hypothetical protein
MSLIIAQQSLGITYDFVVRNVANDAITVGGNDSLRVTIEREGDTSPKFQLTGFVANGNGSQISRNTPSTGTNRVRIDADDLTFELGLFSLLVDFFDNEDAQEWKRVDRQTFLLES